MPRLRSSLADEVLATTAAVASSAGASASLADLVHHSVRELREAGAASGSTVRVRPRSDGLELVKALACWRIGAVPWMSSGTSDTDDRSDIEVIDEGTAAVMGQHVAVLHETSGSTGRPQLVMRSADSLVAEARGYRSGLGLVPGEGVRVAVPTTHSFGWGVSMAALQAGCRLDARPFAKPTSVAADVDQGRAAVLAVTPPGASLLARTQRTGTHRPRAFLIGAGAVSPRLEDAIAARFGVPSTRGYGSTETGGILIGHHGIGSPIEGLDVVAPAPGETGELVVRSSAGVLGYVGEARDPGADWHTGDVVERPASGPLRFVARHTGAVRLNGRYVDTLPIAAAVAGVRGVEDVAFVVTPRDNRPGIEDLVVVAAGRGVSSEEVWSAAQGEGAGESCPRVQVLESLPRTAIGKVDRAALEGIVVSNA